MTNLSDPNTVHEILAILLVAVSVAGAILAMAYIRVLGKFFEELRVREPAVWTRVGSPGLLGMLVLPFRRFRKYYAFLPVLRQRAATRDRTYRYAAPAYLLLKAGLAMMLMLFGLVCLTVFWIAYHAL